ncbi:MAG: glycine--tRNA ligase subunit alpha [Streptococcus salivarius]
MLLENFEKFEKEAGRALELGLVHPAYDYVLKCSHTFNLLDARGVFRYRTCWLHRPYP